MLYNKIYIIYLYVVFKTFPKFIDRYYLFPIILI